MTDVVFLDRAVVVLYFLVTMGAAALVSRHIASFDDFLVAGRRLSAPLLICTLVSTYYGLGVLLAGSEISYEAGLVNWFFDTAPSYVLMFLAALLVAAKVRQRDFRSVPDIIEAYYGRGARVMVATASFVYALPAFSIMGMGGLFHLLFGIPFVWGMVLGSAVTLAYTAMGGLLAVAVTDALQFLIMATTLALAAAIGLPKVGGVPEMVRVLPDHFHPMGDRPLGMLVVYGLTSLSILIEPAFYQRIFAARSTRTVIVALSVGVVLWMSYDWIITMLGIGARVAEIKGLIGPPPSPENAVTQFVLRVLPVGLTGLFAAGLMAAAMSTMDSYLLISASTLVYDIWRPLWSRQMSDAALVRWTRLTLVVATGANIAVCLYFLNVERLWIFMTAILICTALVPVLAALYWPGVKRRAGAAAAATGLGLVCAYYAWVDLAGQWLEDEAAYVWQGRLLGVDLQLNQDYGILYILPLVIAVFLVAQLAPGGRPR
ncbi:MAG: sodium:solute symporter family protein [Gemmatimonadota bacterium]